MKKLGIIGPIDAEGKRIIREKLADLYECVEVADKGEFDRLSDVEAIILRTLSIRAADMDGMSRLRHIQRWGAGYDTVDVCAAGERGIVVTVAAGVNAQQVSEYAILLMLAVYRNLVQVDRNVRAGKWRDPGLIARSFTLASKKVGLLGLGSIGKMVAQKANAFGAEVLYHDLRRLSPQEERALNVSFRTLDRLAEESDVVSVHVPFGPDTKHIVNRDFLRRMKKIAILINSSRGGTVDESALYEVLAGGLILGAGLDVFENEPVDPGNPLLTLDNVVLSSHFGGNTADLIVSMALSCVENVRAVCSGTLPQKPQLVNGEFLRNARPAP